MGTLDGANIEISELVGKDNCVIFGLKEDEINTIRYNNSYNPWDIYNADPTIKKVMDSLVDGTFADDYEKFRMIFNEVMYHNDEYFILADFHNYDQARFETENFIAIN